MRIQVIVWWLIALALLGGGGVFVYAKIRGIRNNNPGNLRRTSDQWRGLRDNQTDPEYFQFVHARWGIRAMGQTLVNYYRRHQLSTVEGIVRRYAPSVENDTESYIRSIAGKLDLRPGESFNVERRIDELVRAMIRHENGVQPYSDELIAEGLSLMFS